MQWHMQYLNLQSQYVKYFSKKIPPYNIVTSKLTLLHRHTHLSQSVRYESALSVWLGSKCLDFSLILTIVLSRCADTGAFRLLGLLLLFTRTIHIPRVLFYSYLFRWVRLEWLEILGRRVILGRLESIRIIKILRTHVSWIAIHTSP